MRIARNAGRRVGDGGSSEPGPVARGTAAASRRVRLVARQAINAPGDGTLYRYRDTSAVILTVFHYPLGDSIAASTPDPAGRVRAEGKLFQDALAERARAGRYPQHRVLVARPDSVITGSEFVPGHMTAVAVRIRGTPSIDLQYLYLIDTTYIKIRLTVPEQQWPRADLPAFVEAIVRHAARSEQN